jgi:tRNA (guanine-N7-)-methyltransferase
MGKNKLKRFEENKQFAHLLQPPAVYPFTDHSLKGKWNENFFSVPRPIVLELGCGRGEYTVNLAQNDPSKNYIGVDIKGARIWRGAKTVDEEDLRNVGFLRIQIERIENFFGTDEVEEIWITFPDPQLQESRERKRLTSPRFLESYRKFVRRGGRIHLKTDNVALYDYTLEKVREMSWPVEYGTTDLYEEGKNESHFDIRTTYEKIYLSRGMKICYLRFQVA